MERSITKSRTHRAFTILALALGIASALFAGVLSPAHASGDPIQGGKVLPGQGRDMRKGTPVTSNGRKVDILPKAQGAAATAGTVYSLGNPLIFVHGLNTVSYDHITCEGSAGLWTNPINYLKTVSGYTGTENGKTHSGLGGDTIRYDGRIDTIGFYDNDVRCQHQINTRTGPSYYNQCNGYGGPVYTGNNDSSVGTTNEPIEHVACELAWYLYDTYGSSSLNIVTHSMGGLIVRFMLYKVGHDSHFPAALFVGDVVTFSTPHGGISDGQLGYAQFACGIIMCNQLVQMRRNRGGFASYFMGDITSNANNPQATGGTDWTMEGSLSDDDPLDWFWQATYMSNGHRLGYGHRTNGTYDAPIKCNGVTQFQNGYEHGSYVNDGCDYYDAPQYYRDFGGRDDQTYYYTTAAPHSLHNMLLAFLYYGW